MSMAPESNLGNIFDYNASQRRITQQAIYPNRGSEMVYKSQIIGG